MRLVLILVSLEVSYEIYIVTEFRPFLYNVCINVTDTSTTTAGVIEIFLRMVK